MSIPNGRAVTEKERRAVIEAIYAYWLGHPHLRLGQMLVNASAYCSGRSLFYVEDKDLVQALKEWEENNG